MPIWTFLMFCIASWWQPDAMYSGMHVCAANHIPISSKIEIVNSDNGRMSNCVVIAKGPAAWTGRELDVSPEVRDDLGLYDPGTAHVRIYAISGYLRLCHLKPQPQTCKTPPKYCVLDLPKPAILECP